MWDRHRLVRAGRRGDTLDGRFWIETAALSLLCGTLIAVAIRVTGRETEILVAAALAGMIKLFMVADRSSR